MFPKYSFKSIIIINIFLTVEVYGKIHNPKNKLICNKLNCPNTRGICTRDNKCICIGDFITVEQKELYGNYQCNYKARNQAITFLLEFLIGFGVGHFYLGNYILAGIKFTFCLITAIIVAIFPCLKTNQVNSNVLSNLMIIMGIFFVIWQIVDGVLIVMNVYKDGMGIKMNSSWV